MSCPTSTPNMLQQQCTRQCTSAQTDSVIAPTATSAARVKFNVRSLDVHLGHNIYNQTGQLTQLTPRSIVRNHNIMSTYGKKWAHTSLTQHRNDKSTGVPRGGLKGVQTPPIESSKSFYCVFAKYTLQALFLCTLNTTFYASSLIIITSAIRFDGQHKWP